MTAAPSSATLQRALPLLVALSLGAAGAWAQDVELYEQTDFRGRKLGISSATPDLRLLGANDRTHSVIVHRGQWEFCTDALYRGQCVTTGPGRFAQLPDGFPGRLSSLRPAGAAPGPASASIVLYEHEFSGESRTVSEAVPDLSDRRFQNAAWSVEVLSGRWELCNQSRYAGQCLTLGVGRHVLYDDTFRRRIVSLRPVGPGSAPPAMPPRPGPAAAAITLYEDAGQQGRSLALDGAAPRLGELDFNDRASSAVVARGRWQLCEHADYGGRCVELGPGRHALEGWINDAVSSLRPSSADEPRPGRDGAVRLHEHVDFSGRQLLREQATPNLGAFDFNDKASSVEVFGMPWELCSDADYGGRCIVLAPGRHQLPSGLHDELSSLRPARRQAR